jgi:hypothetical protein
MTIFHITDSNTGCDVGCKVKFILEQNMRTKRGGRGISLLFFERRGQMGLVGNATPRFGCLNPGRETRYALSRMLAMSDVVSEYFLGFTQCLQVIVATTASLHIGTS